MTQPLAPSAGQSSSTPSLPGAPILSYLTQISSPTRVRNVAAGGVRAFAWVHLLCMFLWGSVIAARVYYWFDFYWGGAVAGKGGFWGAKGPGPSALVWAVLRCDWMFIPLLVMGFYLLSLQLAQKHVLAGRRTAALYVLYLLGMLAPCWLLMAVITALAGYGALDIGAPHPEPHLLGALWFLGLPAGLFLFLLNLDLCSLLLWIARAPLTEKPPVPFLPGKATPEASIAGGTMR